MKSHWNLNGNTGRLGALLLVACLGAFAAPDKGYVEVGGPYPNDPMHTHIYRLDNGLEVYLSVNRETPRFFAEIAVRAGSKNDPSDTTGLAHYMEHLLFKGSSRMGALDYEQEKPYLDRIAELYERHFHAQTTEERRAIYEEITRESTQAASFAAPNEIDRLYRAMGGRDLNAHTWHEEVVYKINLPINCLENWAIIESDRFAHPVFRLFQTELETVYEEMNRALDNKDRIIQNAVNARLFKNHPYGQQPTLGKVEHLKSPSIRKLEDFYRTWYVPNNMAVFISGDIDPEETIALIARYFSAWEPRPLPEPQRWEEEPLAGREEVRVPYRSEEFVLLAFRTAPRQHGDMEALMMLDMILDNAVAGLINLNLNQQQRVREAGAFPMFMNDYGAEFLYGVPKDGQSKEEVEKLLLEQVALIREGNFADWIIPAIVNDYKKREKTGLESDAARVSAMRDAWIAYEPWERACGAIDRMAAVTREDVIRVANLYFGENYVAGFREDAPHNPPLVEKPPMPEIVIDPTVQSPFAKELLARPLKAIEPVFLEEGKNFVRLVDPKGLIFLHAPNPVNDVFSLSLVVDYGTRQDSRMAVAARLLQRTGTETLSAEDLKIAWYKLGTDFSVDVGDNEITVSLSGLDDQFDASLALLGDMLERPKIDAQTLEELKRIILAQREDSWKDPGDISGALVNYNRYGDDSPWLHMLPGDAVMALTAEELQQVVRDALGCRQHVLYSGSLPMEKVAEAVNRLHVSRTELSAPPPYYHQNMRAPGTSEIYHVNREMAQSHVTLEFGSVPYDSAMSPAVQLYNMYFAGSMSGIVFQELREVRALAYVVGARYTAGDRRDDQNIMLGVIQTQADKTVEALRAFTELMDDLPLSEERYAMAREALLNDYRSGRTGFREAPGVLLSWERRGLEPDPRESWYAAIVSAEKMDMMAAFHKQYIAGKAKLISVVGDTARMDMEGLAAFADVRPVTVDEIFVK